MGLDYQCTCCIGLHPYCQPFQGEPVSGPLPLGVAVIDSSVRLYGLVFPHVAHKHRLQMLEHFGECIKQAKASRQQAIQINIFTAVLYALKVKRLILFKQYCHQHTVTVACSLCQGTRQLYYYAIGPFHLSQK